MVLDLMWKFCALVMTLGALLASGEISAAVPPTSFSRIDFATAPVMLVVARISGGAALPQPPECDGSDLERICLNSPFWFRANIARTVYGRRAPRKLYVVASSHYSMEELTEDRDLQLMLLHVEGDKAAMRRDDRAYVFKNRSGELYLIPLGEQPYRWLPCSATALRTEISREDFPTFEPYSKSEVEELHLEAPEQAFREVRDGLFPRYGIAVKVPERHLAAIAPSPLEMSCGPRA